MFIAQVFKEPVNAFSKKPFLLHFVWGPATIRLPHDIQLTYPPDGLILAIGASKLLKEI